jgi:hypothetical protein
MADIVCWLLSRWRRFVLWWKAEGFVSSRLSLATAYWLTRGRDRRTFGSERILETMNEEALRHALGTMPSENDSNGGRKAGLHSSMASSHPGVDQFITSPLKRRMPLTTCTYVDTIECAVFLRQYLGNLMVDTDLSSIDGRLQYASIGLVFPLHPRLQV